MEWKSLYIFPHGKKEGWMDGVMMFKLDGQDVVCFFFSGIRRLGFFVLYFWSM